MSEKKKALALDRARAIHALQLQTGIGVKGKGYAYAAEFLDESHWSRLKKHAPLLLLSAARAQRLGLKTEHGIAAIAAHTLTLNQLWRLAAGSALKAASAPAPAFGGDLVALAKEAGVLPALIWIASPALPKDVFALDMKALTTQDTPQVLQGETVSLPIEGAEDSTLTGFRTRYGAGVHLALVIGKPKRETAPLVRVHSSCVTGDLLGSLRCDCGGQLRLAIQRIREEGAGILLYLHQEGRDIGISSKLRAYALQEQGIDTFDANQQLGFEEDERDFSIAAAMLKALGHTEIRLLTNNPAKIDGFKALGIAVKKRVALVAGSNTHSHRYLDTKKKKHGHLF